MNRTKPCKFIVNKENCPFGRRCRFLHQYFSSETRGESVEQPELVEGTTKTDDSDHSCPEVLEQALSCNTNLHQVKKACRFYQLNAYCKYGDRCRYAHHKRLETSSQNGVEEGGRRVKERRTIYTCDRRVEERETAGSKTTKERAKDDKGTTRSKNEDEKQTAEGTENSRDGNGDKEGGTDGKGGEKRGSTDGKGGEERGSRDGKGGEKRGSTDGKGGEERGSTRVRTADSETAGGEKSNAAKKAEEGSRNDSLKLLRKSSEVKVAPQDSAWYTSSRNPPPLTLASFIGGRAHVQRPQRKKQSQKNDSRSLREVC